MTGYPFSALVGLDDLRQGLLVAAVCPEVAGVLVRGEKGTAKTTAVRALAALLPPVAVVPGCAYACDPGAPDPDCPDGPHPVGAAGLLRPVRLVELPVGAGEDRLLGSLDLERALTEGVRAFTPGLLAAANRGILYVDEVNLLPDHLVDALLDAAATGRHHVEREGVSVRHAARFTLVGTMNPEEGELRPQLLDRFGLAVDVRAPRDPRERAEVVRRRLAFDADPAGFAAGWEAAERELAGHVARARQGLAGVRLTEAALVQLTGVCAAMEVDGLRADLVTARAAMALAAWADRRQVGPEDVEQAARLALAHRGRRGPLDPPGAPRERLEQVLAEQRPPAGPGGSRTSDDADGPGGPPDPPGPGGPDGPGGAGGRTGSPPGGGAGGPGDAGGHCAAGDLPPEPAQTNSREPADQAAGPAGGPPVAPASAFRPLVLRMGPGRGDAAGRRALARTARGRLTGAARPNGRPLGLHLPATLVAAAPEQVARGRAPGGPLRLRRVDLREPVRQGMAGALVVFCLDASGSMGARERVADVKAAVLSLLLDAYQRRDRVALVSVRGEAAEVVLPPTASVALAAARLADLPTGGRTPLADGLARAHGIIRRERMRDPGRRPLLVIVTDGRATAGPGCPDPTGDVAAAAGALARAGVPSLVVDGEVGFVRLGLAGRLAGLLGGALITLEALPAGALASAVRVCAGGSR